jgi:hypothetical protein
VIEAKSAGLEVQIPEEAAPQAGQVVDLMEALSKRRGRQGAPRRGGGEANAAGDERDAPAPAKKRTGKKAAAKKDITASERKSSTTKSAATKAAKGSKSVTAKPARRRSRR